MDWNDNFDEINAWTTKIMAKLNDDTELILQLSWDYHCSCGNGLCNMDSDYGVFIDRIEDPKTGKTYSRDDIKEWYYIWNL